jgi:cyanophycinase-like exopeptidase
MAGMLALIGGEEFAEGFEDTHARLLSLIRFVRPGLQGHTTRVAFLPTCAADDGPEAVDYWCELAQQKLGALGAEVFPLRVIDHRSANDPELAQLALDVDWIYLGGGYPHVAMRILKNSVMLEAIHTARQQGTLISGASGGAMLMCARSWMMTPELDSAVSQLWDEGGDFSDLNVPLPPMLNCLGYIPRSVCWPHINRLFAPEWLNQGLLPSGFTLIGIDEQTAVVSLAGDQWDVLGKGRVVLVDSSFQQRVFHPGDQLTYPP